MRMNLRGIQLNQYTLLQFLSEENMTESYLAEDNSKRQVMIKLLHTYLSKGEIIERFKQETPKLKNLIHPHIARLLEVNSQAQYHYLVMEYPKGPSLAQVLKNGALPLETALRTAEQISGALAYAHANGVVHRDVKPQSIYFSDDNLNHALLTDFGIAQLFDNIELTTENSIVGTPAYISPEIAQGQPSTDRTDVYSLGIVLYEMLTGRPPFSDSSTIATMMQHIKNPIPSLEKTHPEFPPHVGKLIEKALAKQDKIRPSSIEFQSLIETSFTKPSTKKSTYTHLIIGVSGIVVLGLIVILIWLALGKV